MRNYWLDVCVVEEKENAWKTAMLQQLGLLPQSDDIAISGNVVINSTIAISTFDTFQLI